MSRKSKYSFEQKKWAVEGIVNQWILVEPIGWPVTLAKALGKSSPTFKWYVLPSSWTTVTGNPETTPRSFL